MSDPATTQQPVQQTGYVYACVTKKCTTYQQEVRTEFSPSSYRLYTGSAARCSRCGNVLRFLRQEAK